MTYCISDIHGCYTAFMTLLEQIHFDPEKDTLYVLGDVIDRGDKSLECLRFVMRTKSVHLLIGNHERMMLDFYDGTDDSWDLNGNEEIKKQINGLPENEREKLFSWLRKRPYYKTVGIDDKRYFLSHAGLTVGVPFRHQDPESLVWSREEFFEHPALERYTCIFGHTPTPMIRNNPDYSAWFDEKYRDKVCIDCGCVYGGALCVIRLDDGAVFYEMATPMLNIPEMSGEEKDEEAALPYQAAVSEMPLQAGAC